MLTTVAPQAFFFLNSKFVRGQSVGLASRLHADQNATDAQRFRLAYGFVFGRLATDDEVEGALAYLKSYLDTVAPERKVRESKVLVPDTLPPYAELVRKTPGILGYYDFDDTERENGAESSGHTPSFSSQVLSGKADIHPVGPSVSRGQGVLMFRSGSRPENHAVSLNGQNQRLVISDPSLFHVDTGELSVEYWVHPESIGQATIIGRDGDERL